MTPEDFSSKEAAYNAGLQNGILVMNATIKHVIEKVRKEYGLDFHDETGPEGGPGVLDALLQELELK